ncbi:MAG TPA: cell division FtsA domain-containing protein, partial [Candidatus Paceibacterota bacterium]
DAAKSIRSAVRQAEKMADVEVKKAYLAIGGIGLGAVVSSGSTMITKADGEVSALDIEQALASSENEIPRPLIINRKIIHTVPLQYKIDGISTLGKAEGLKGSKLEVKTLFITCLEHHINDLVQAAEEAGIQVEDVIAAPIAASMVTLTKLQKVAGCALANIGAETVSISVFENNLPVSLEVFPIGSNDITNDIALGLKIPLEEAEVIKVHNLNNSPYSKKKIEEIIGARLSDIFELIEAHLKKIGRNGLLPAGIVITGGGAGLTEIDNFAKLSLNIPSRVGIVHVPVAKNTIKDATWAVVYGLTIIGFTSGEDDSTGLTFLKTKKSIVNWFRQFLP